MSLDQPSGGIRHRKMHHTFVHAHNFKQKSPVVETAEDENEDKDDCQLMNVTSNNNNNNTWTPRRRREEVSCRYILKMLRVVVRRTQLYSLHYLQLLPRCQPSVKWFRRSLVSTTTTTPILPVFKQAERFKDNIALSDQHGEHTYEQIHRLSGHLAWLIQNILGEDTAQERVAFLCPNDVSYVISQWATWMAGHIAVPLYPRHPPPELEYFVRDSKAAVIITTSEYAPKVKQILSGQQAWGWTQRDTLLHCLPLHHTHGIVNALLCPLYLGARVVMLPSFSPAEVWSHLLALNVPVEARVSLFMAVPTMYVKLLEEYHASLAKTSRTKEYTPFINETPPKKNCEELTT
ncbi:Acyl-CoA synthetase family member 3, mitochondrial [Portunus trituberculatus]|uniref:Acyl-CoA synthetase family member 3, mitochondrial n=1 Tax=Portunus trituberculatus TaxID=210409 RepID=A0A5B7DNE1_PORTR|nr:Acyl-CoA synthetase family member 3, mitochondrial [Portunus trituberculatus]